MGSTRHAGAPRRATWRHGRGSQRGVLLIELLAALALFGVAIASLVPSFVIATRGIEKARRVSAAAALAQDEVEQIRNTAYAAVTAGSDTVQDTTTGVTYTRQWTLGAGPAASTQSVTVTVKWSDPTVHTVTLKTMISA